MFVVSSIEMMNHYFSSYFYCFLLVISYIFGKFSKVLLKVLNYALFMSDRIDFVPMMLLGSSLIGDKWAVGWIFKMLSISILQFLIQSLRNVGSTAHQRLHRACIRLLLSSERILCFLYFCLFCQTCYL